MFSNRMDHKEFSITRFLRIGLVLGMIFHIFVSCAITPHPTRSIHAGQDTALGSCADFFAKLDDRVAKKRVIDPGAFRVEHFPYLRINRFLASFNDEVSATAAFSTWLDHMMALDRQARRFEIANLNSSTKALNLTEDNIEAVLNRVTACGNLLRQADFLDPSSRLALVEAIEAPDDYISLRRWLGLYPLTRLFVAAGVSNWHQEAHKKFSPMPPINWQTHLYYPQYFQNVDSIDRLFLEVQQDALGIPVFSDEDQRHLFRRYAPVWEIQDGGKADRIGRPYWTSAGTLDVDTTQPVTYTILSFTRLKGRVLIQLNYIIWFPARPKTHTFDIFGGLLDGLIYRVTLDSTGAPLLYETVHNCGCYYKAYPTDRLITVEESPYAEPPLVLIAPAMNHSESIMVVAMEAGTHYVNHLYPLKRQEIYPASEEIYPSLKYAELRSLEMPKGGRRSMFAQNSVAEGSERLERLILWPTGVYSPGAMRQWGRHAVAFAGKRHFDDPFYMDMMFRLK